MASSTTTSVPEIVPSSSATLVEASPPAYQPHHYTAHVRILCDTNLDDDSRLQQCIKIGVARAVFYMQLSQPFIDLIVAFVAIPLLVMFGLLLQASLQDTYQLQEDHRAEDVAATAAIFDTEIISDNNDNSDETEIILSDRISTKNFNKWDENLRTRWTRVGLAIAMLSVCLILLGYISQRLGMCFWKKQPRIIHRFEERYHTDDSDNESNAGCSTQLYSEDPPSYDLVVNCYDMPPPAYHTITLPEDFPKIHKQIK